MTDHQKKLATAIALSPLLIPMLAALWMTWRFDRLVRRIRRQPV